MTVKAALDSTGDNLTCILPVPPRPNSSLEHGRSHWTRMEDSGFRGRHP
jgi:hypothetical protein